MNAILDFLESFSMKKQVRLLRVEARILESVGLITIADRISLIADQLDLENVSKDNTLLADVPTWLLAQEMEKRIDQAGAEEHLPVIGTKEWIPSPVADRDPEIEVEVIGVFAEETSTPRQIANGQS